MLITNKVRKFSRTQSILDLMETSNFQFRLTGSRYFGWDTEESDWDFFTLGSRTVETTLRSFGLSENVQEGYQDGLVGKVFGGHSVHVQLVNDVEAKQELNEFFARNKQLIATPPSIRTLNWTPKSKDVQRAAWQTAVSMLMCSKKGLFTLPRLSVVHKHHTFDDPDIMPRNDRRPFGID